MIWAHIHVLLKTCQRKFDFKTRKGKIEASSMRSINIFALMGGKNFEAVNL